ncbi:MAG: DNA-protecting protein DprA [Candidatus Magasanikbacteria bacterium]|nr:DNA-protecting protein DprA [Candidatus Magasanikbacteria bacterium]
MKKEILLAHWPKITVKRHQQLLGSFSSLDSAWRATSADFEKMGWKDELVTNFLDWKDNVDEEKIKKILEQEKISCILKDNENYPELLKEIYDAPFCLFTRGKLDNEGFTLAVVGPRKFSSYGKQITEEIVSELAGQGIVIASGLALGIDSIAHNATLQAGGKTVAILGSGINDRHIYPARHRGLANDIVKKGGAVISEYPPGALPSKFTFPRRNRIVAGISLGTLVIEAAEGSGALITAQSALDNNREVFAVPQNITSPNSAGVNMLIKNGAHPVTCAQDVIDALDLKDIKNFISNREIVPDSPTEAKLLEFLSREPIHVDQLVKNSSLDSPSVNATLTMMEMKGKVRNMGGMMYVLSR